MKDIRFNEENALTLRRVGFVSVKRNAGDYFEFKKGREIFAFVSMECGALEYSFQTGARYHIAPGDAIFIPKHLPCKVTYLEDGSVSKVLLFDTDGALLPPAFSAPILRSGADIGELLRSISGESMRNSLYLCAKIYELLSIFKSERALLPKKHLRILPAIGEIKERYYENHPLSHYAALCHMSESNFRLLFKQYTGHSPIEYRNRIRIAEARRMIDSGEFTVGEAAYLAGFNNMSFFYEQLKADKG